MPYVVSWNLTRQCNLRCKHCYIDAARPMTDELSTDEAIRVIDQIADVTPETLLIMTGGEPLLRSDLEVLVERASSRGMLVVLGTNGTLLDKDRALALAERGLSGVGISIDSLVPSSHDEFRGLEGAWKDAVAGIESARGAGLDVQLQMTMRRENIEEIPQVVEFTRKAGAKVLTVFFLVCTGRGQEMVDLTPEEYERCLTFLVRQEFQGVMVRPRCAPTFRRVLAQTRPDSIFLKSDMARCMAAKSYCRITPDGKVTPCPYIDAVAGSLRDDSFEVVWRSAPLLQSLRKPSLGGRCGECEYGDLCGGCRARAFARSGNPLDEDPWCTHLPGSDRPPGRVEEAGIAWTPDAESRIQRAPFFVRKMIRGAVEAFARQQGASSVTPDILDQARRTMRRP